MEADWDASGRCAAGILWAVWGRPGEGRDVDAALDGDEAWAGETQLPNLQAELCWEPGEWMKCVGLLLYRLVRSNEVQEAEDWDAR